MESVTLASIRKLLEEQTDTIVRKFKKEIDDRDRKIQNLGRTCLYLERKLRKNNVIIFGLQLNKNNLVNHVITEVNRIFSTSITAEDINNVYAVNKRDNSPVVIEFLSFLKKLELFRDKQKLKALKGTGIAITNDLCKQDRMENKILRKHFIAAKEEGKQATIGRGKIQIEGVWYTAEDLEQEEIDSNNDSENIEEEIDEDEGGSGVGEGSTGGTKTRSGQARGIDITAGDTRERNPNEDEKKRKSQDISPHYPKKNKTKKKSRHH